MLPAQPDEGSADPRPCIVHLVRKANGLAELCGFAQALRMHPPGIDHELVLAMKGFGCSAEAKPYLEEVADLAPTPLFFADRGFDLGVFFAAAKHLRRGRYCFLNSYSRPLVAGWLAKMDAALARANVGQVGATGGWGSRHSWLMYSLGLPSAYRGVMPPATETRRQFGAIDTELNRGATSGAEAIRARLADIRRLPGDLASYEPFPSPHLRPNAFMITHGALAELELPVVRDKIDTYVLESSRRSITRQLERLGLISLVVDADGHVYRPDAWEQSRTLWQHDQEGLLVADNRTRSYANGNLARRRVLASFAWGSKADPSAPHADSHAA